MKKARILAAAVVASMAFAVSACSSPTAPDDHTLGSGNHTLGSGNHTLGSGNHTLGSGNHTIGSGN